MKYPDKIKLDEPHYVVSLKHTTKKDKYLTLWRPDNKGYCWSIKDAGLYEEIIWEYHLDDGNVPVPASAMVKYTVVDSDGRLCVENSKKSISMIEKWRKSLRQNAGNSSSKK